MRERMGKPHGINGTPGAIAAALAELQSERRAVGSRLDALDLAIDTLQRAYGLNGHASPLAAAKAPSKRPVSSSDSAAADRRALLLTAIGKSDVGLTLSDLRKATPKMDGKDRSSALQSLKTEGKIKRSGNAWTTA
jgi:hypothetical protein